MNKSNKCPFTIGAKVVYRPSKKGAAADVMAPLAERLTPGEQYVVTQIQDDLYVVVEGYSHPGGGIYWTEFELSH